MSRLLLLLCVCVFIDRTFFLAVVHVHLGTESVPLECVGPLVPFIHHTGGGAAEKSFCATPYQVSATQRASIGAVTQPWLADGAGVVSSHSHKISSTSSFSLHSCAHGRSYGFTEPLGAFSAAALLFLRQSSSAAVLKFSTRGP